MAIDPPIWAHETPPGTPRGLPGQLIFARNRLSFIHRTARNVTPNRPTIVFLSSMTKTRRRGSKASSVPIDPGRGEQLIEGDALVVLPTGVLDQTLPYGAVS